MAIPPATESMEKEHAELTAVQNKLNSRYLSLNDEIKAAERIRINVYNILKQEERLQQPQKNQNLDL